MGEFTHVILDERWLSKIQKFHSKFEENLFGFEFLITYTVTDTFTPFWEGVEEATASSSTVISSIPQGIFRGDYGTGR